VKLELRSKERGLQTLGFFKIWPDGFGAANFFLSKRCWFAIIEAEEGAITSLDARKEPWNKSRLNKNFRWVSKVKNFLHQFDPKGTARLRHRLFLNLKENSKSRN